MRLPKTPPPWRDFFSRLLENQKKLLPALTATQNSASYFHWDDFRHRAPLEGLTIEESWAVTKFGRLSRQEMIPLKDRLGRPFTFSLTQQMFEQLQRIDRACAGVIGFPEPITNPATRDRYLISSLMEESITSSLLEGAAVTRAEAKEILRSGRAARTGGEQMIVNNYLTMRRLSTLKKEPLAVASLLYWHRQLTDRTLEDPSAAGRLRRPDEEVRIEHTISGEVVHVPPSAHDLPARLEAMCQFANDLETRGFLHPILRSIILHFWLAYDHPFVDGNGRTARALFYWSMLRHGFWLFEFISISQILLKAPAKYYRAFLLTETDDNDLNYFILHQLHAINAAIEALHGYLAKKSAERAGMQRQLEQFAELNHRQIAVLRRALERPETVFTYESHMNSHGIVRQTARTDLLGLAEKGFLKQRKSGRLTVFQAASELETKLQTGASKGI